VTWAVAHTGKKGDSPRACLSELNESTVLIRRNPRKSPTASNLWAEDDRPTNISRFNTLSSEEKDQIFNGPDKALSHSQMEFNIPAADAEKNHMFL
jgi:hypothetical protein